jgi:hypothetical protein
MAASGVTEPVIARMTSFSSSFSSYRPMRGEVSP